MVDISAYSAEIGISITIALWLSALTAGVGKILFWTALVASKQYRVDRFIDFLSTRKGLALLIHPVGVSDTIIALILVLLAQQYDATSAVWLDFSLLSIGIYTWHAFWYFFSRPLPQLPRWQLKSALLFIGSLFLSTCTMILLLLFTEIPVVLQLALFQSFIPLYGWMILGLFTPLLALHDRSQEEKARKKIADIAPVIIAVAGSYGKSATILYLEALLRDSFSVARTPHHSSSSDETIQTILEDLQPEHQIFITELHPADIRDMNRISTIAPPIMTIITELDILHDRSGASMGTLKTLYIEALAALPLNGLAILNRDDEDVFTLAEKAHVRTKFFSSQDIAHVYATDIFINRDAVEFVLHVGNDKRLVRAPLFGKHVVHAILAATTAATHLGLSLDDIVSRIERMAPHNTLGGLHATYGINHALIIDNTTAQSLAECSSGIEYASLYTEKNRIVIVPPEILDIDACFSDILDTADMCIITGAGRAGNQYVEKCVAQGLAPESVMHIDSPNRLIQMLHQSATPNDVIILQGRIPEEIRTKVLEP